MLLGLANMETKTLKPTKQAIEAAVKVLRNGDLVVYPTESAYALGCDATNAAAAEKIFTLKKRGKKPLPMIVGDVKTAEKYGIINHYARSLLKRFSPGPLTLIVPKKDGIPEVVNNAFVFRIPDSNVARELASSLGKPVVSTSANISGEGAIYSFAKVKKLFSGKVDVIIDGGDLVPRPVSTIVDIKSGKIVREGAVSAKEIASTQYEK